MAVSFMGRVNEESLVRIFVQKLLNRIYDAAKDREVSLVPLGLVCTLDYEGVILKPGDAVQMRLKNGDRRNLRVNRSAIWKVLPPNIYDPTTNGFKEVGLERIARDIYTHIYRDIKPWKYKGLKKYFVVRITDWQLSYEEHSLQNAIYLRVVYGFGVDE